MSKESRGKLQERVYTVARDQVVNVKPGNLDGLLAPTSAELNRDRGAERAAGERGGR